MHVSSQSFIDPCTYVPLEPIFRAKVKEMHCVVDGVGERDLTLRGHLTFGWLDFPVKG
jgi:hypothetical protein